MKILKLISINRAFGDFHEKEGTIIGRMGRENKAKRRDSFDGSFSFPILLSFLSLLGKILGQFTEAEPPHYFRFQKPDFKWTQSIQSLLEEAKLSKCFL